MGAKTTVKKLNSMEGDSKNLEKNPNWQFGDMEHDGRTFLQPVRIRHNPVLVDDANWQFVASEFRFVLLSGIVLWALYFLSLAL
jgi:hypothetical protein